MSVSTTEATRPNRTVATRRIVFDHEAEALPRYFVDGDLLQSHILAVLSAAFPKGEDFFVASVRAHRDQLADPALKAQAAGFIGQESMHGREHDRLNAHLHELGYPVASIDRNIGRLFVAVRKLTSKRLQLSMTAALEHYTAVVAEHILSDPAFEQQRVPDEIRALLRWHALEECEHRAVAFDVYRATGGGEPGRVAGMAVATAILAPFVAGAVLHSLLVDRELRRRPVKLLLSLRKLPTSPLARGKLIGQLASYKRRGFHPDDRDVDELLARWRKDLFGPDGSLVGHLKGAEHGELRAAATR